jgi:hypothetical protein
MGDVIYYVSVDESPKITVTVQPPEQILVNAVNDTTYDVSINTPDKINVSVSPQSGPQGLMNNDLIVEVNSASAETAAFAAGSKIVIRNDLI